MNLAQHPRIVPPNKLAFKKFAANHKEVHFFDKESKYNQGIGFYRKFFIGPPQQFYYFESTPNYLFHSKAPYRIKKLLPKAKFIVMLRNPVDRAWSHFCNWRKKCNWDLSILRNSNHEILLKGIYHLQLARWFERFDRSQFLIIRSEDYFSNEHHVIKEVFEFIGIEAHVIENPIYYDPVKCERGNPKMPVNLRRNLKTFYRPHNNELQEMLDRVFAWERR